RRLRSFFFNDTAHTEIYTLSLHDALPICSVLGERRLRPHTLALLALHRARLLLGANPNPDENKLRLFLSHAKSDGLFMAHSLRADRKSTRLNSSHLGISYAVFCLKKKIHITSHAMCCSNIPGTERSAETCRVLLFSRCSGTVVRRSTAAGSSAPSLRAPSGAALAH